MEEMYTRDLLHALQTHLARIAAAAEEQNKQSREWMATQLLWHEEVKAVEAERTEYERRIAEIQEREEARRRMMEEAWQREVAQLEKVARGEEE